MRFCLFSYEFCRKNLNWYGTLDSSSIRAFIYSFRYTIKSKKKKPVKRRQNESPVNSLDKYGKLHSTLTLEERNKIRDLAFEYSGYVSIPKMNNYA